MSSLPLVLRRSFVLSSQGPENEKLKLMYAAYDLSGVAPSEERTKTASKSCSIGIGSGKNKPSRRSKYLTLEDMAAVLTSASEGAYPTLLEFNNAAKPHGVSSGDVADGGGALSPDSSERSTGRVFRRCGSEGERGGWERGECRGESKSEWEKTNSSLDNTGAVGVGTAAAMAGGRRESAGDEAEGITEALKELARRNAASYAARAVSEFGQVQDGALTQKEFERWALSEPVLRCRIHEFSIDVNIVPFQGVRLA